MRHLIILLTSILCVGKTQAETLEYSSLNIDFGAIDKTPEDNYAAAGTEGFWNAVDALGITPVGNFSDNSQQRPPWLRNVTIRTNVSMFDTTPRAQPFTGNDDAALLGDYIVSGRNDIQMTIEGLPEGNYTLLIYFVGRQDFPRPTTISINNGPNEHIAGNWAGNYEEGTNHISLSLQVGPNGTLPVSINSDNDAFINGMQLRYEAAPISPSDYLDGENWDWIANGKGWSWPFPADDTQGGIGITGTLESRQQSRLSTQITGPCHLRFFWGGNVPTQLNRTASINLIVNGETHVSLLRGGVFDGNFQLYLPKQTNEVIWEVRNYSFSEVAECEFYLDSVVKLDNATNQPPTIVGSTSTYLAGIASNYVYESTDPDGDTPIFQISGNFPPESGSNHGLPLNFTYKNNLDGSATLIGSNPLIDSIGLHPVSITLNDGGGEISNELKIEIKSPIRIERIRHTEATNTADLFGAEIENSKLIFLKKDTAIFHDYSTSILREFILTPAGNWSLESVLNLPSVELDDEAPQQISVDDNRIVLVSKKNEAEQRHLLVYQKDEVDGWFMEGEIEIPGTFQRNYPNFDIEKGWLAVTNPDFINPEDNSQGRLFIYKRNAIEGWNLDSQVTVPYLSHGVESLKIHKDMIVLGACYEFNEEGLPTQEIVKIYHNHATNSWTHLGNIKPNNVSFGYFYTSFGRHLGFSENQLLIAHSQDEGNGSVHVYDLVPNALPLLRQIIRESTSFNLGQSFALSNGLLILGDSRSQLNGYYSGAAYSYTKSNDGNWLRLNLMFPENSIFFGLFGQKTYLSNERIYIADIEGNLHLFNLQTFKNWYRETNEEELDSLNAALTGDKNENGIQDGIDFLKLNHTESAPLLEPGMFAIGDSQYRAVRTPSIELSDLNLEIEYSEDLINWDSGVVQLLDYGDFQFWGIPEESVGPQSFFRIKVLPSF